MNDFLGSAKVGMMSTEEIGAYWLLLFLEWQEVGFVYNEHQLARWCRLTPARFRKAWATISPCFVESDGRLVSPRLEKERAKQQEWRDKSSKGGQTSARARWGEEGKGGGKGGYEMVVTKPQPTPQPNGNTPLLLPLPSPKKKRGTASPGGPAGLELLPQADCDTLWRKWGEYFGAYDRWLFRKDLLKAFQPGMPVFAVSEILNAMEAAQEWWIEQDDREQGFFTFPKFVQQLSGRWVRFGRMDRTEGGVMTERGAWAGSKVIRESSRSQRALG